MHHNLFITEGIDLQRMRQHAESLAKAGDKVTLHLHPYAIDCSGRKHEDYGND